MKFTFAIAAAMMLAGTSAAQPAPQIALFETALENGEFLEAAKHFDSLAAARRPADGKPRSDPLLFGLYGRLVAQEAPSTALAYLKRADAADVPDRLQQAARLALLRVQERIGDRAGVAETLAKLRSSPERLAGQEAIELVGARQLLIEQPASAVAASRNLAGRLPVRSRWEADLIEAQAHALGGDGAAAKAAADRAWSGAADAPADQLAPLRAGLQRAGLAAARGDQDGLLAMLNAVGASVTGLDKSVGNALPVCGGALRPDDWVIFAIYTGTTPEQILMPVAASAPHAVLPFYDALAGRSLLSTISAAPSGTIFTARCRSFLNADWTPVRRGPEPNVEWMAQRGLIIPAFHDASLEGVNALSAEIDALAARYPQSPLLIPLRIELAARLTMRSHKEGDVQEWQVTQAQNKAFEAMRAIGGADGMVPPLWLAQSQRAAAAADSPEESLRLHRAQTLRLILELPAEIGLALASEWLERDVDLPGETKLQVIESLLRRISGQPTDPRRSALLMRKAAVLQLLGNGDAARAAFQAAGAPAALCSAYDSEPKLVSMDITDDDYPAAANRHSIEGVTVIEQEVSADGAVSGHRIILSAPSTIFDPVVAREVKAFKLDPPRRAGKVRACRGLVQRILWKLPSREQEWQAPSFLETPKDET